MKNLFWIICLCNLFIIPFNLSAQWTQTNGPCSAGILSMAYTETEFYVGTGGGGIFRSTDGGANFSCTNNGIPYNTIQDILILNNGVYLATAGGGIYFSDNHGQTWSERNNGISNWSVSSIISTGSYLFAATQQGVFRSSDNAASWSSFSTGLTNQNVKALISNGTKLYAATGGGLFVSENNGESWTALTSTLNSKDLQTVFISGTRIFVSNYNGIYYSDNNGNSWTAPNPNIGASVYSIELIGTTLVAASGGKGCYRSNDNGSSWTASNSSTDYFGPNGRVLMKKGTDLYYGSNGAGLYKSTDNGLTWRQNNSGITSSNVNAIYYADGIMYAGVYGGGVYTSSNQGETWIASNNGITETYLKCFTSFASEVLAGCTFNGGLFVTANKGASWTHYFIGKSVFGLETVTGGSGGAKVFAALGDGLYYSYGNWSQWTKVNSIPSAVIQALGFEGSVGAVSRYSDNRPYITTDYGDTWTQCTGTLPNSAVNSFLINGSTIIAGTSGGIYYTTDNGSSWIDYNEGFTTNAWVYSLQKIPAENTNKTLSGTKAAINPIKVLIGSNQGPFISFFPGKWVSIIGNLSSHMHTQYDYLLFASILYAACAGVGVMKAPIAEIEALVQPGHISGTKFRDDNGNKIQDAGEAGIPGWTIYLSDGRQTQTDANGAYSFVVKATGTFTISEDTVDGWYQTFPAEKVHTVTIASLSDVIEHKDFGNVQPGHISGTKFKDVNGNGTRDMNEEGIHGWTIRLQHGTEVREVRTDANGNYSFEITETGSYTVSEDTIPGWWQTFPPEKIYTIIVTSVSQNFDYKDFGNKPPNPCRQIYPNNDFQVPLNPEFKWVDADDAITCTLIVEIMGPNGYTEVFQQAFNATPSFEHKFQLPIELEPEGQYRWKIITNSSYFGYTEVKTYFNTKMRGFIRGRVYQDDNENGIFDNNEQRIAGWTVTLSDGRSQQTGDYGSYNFEILSKGTITITPEHQDGWVQIAPPPPGIYTIQVTDITEEFRNRDFACKQVQIGKPLLTAPQNFAHVCFPKNITLSWTNPSLTSESEVIISTKPDFPEGQYLEFTNPNAAPGNETHTFNLEQLGTPTTGKQYYWQVRVWEQWGSTNAAVASFTNTATGTISGIKFRDVNGNGSWDANEPGMHGWLIQLSDGRTTRTNSEGEYSFDINALGSFTITEQAVPGWTLTYPPAGLHQVNISELSQVMENLNFGNKPPNKCHLAAPENNSTDVPVKTTFKWVDADDATAVKLVVYNEQGSVVFSQDFQPEAGAEHVYQLQSSLEYLTLYKWNVFTTSDMGTSPAIEGGWTFTTSGPIGRIAGAKFRDANGNGAWDLNEPGIPGWKIMLDDGRETLTDSKGEFYFEVQKTGTFKVTEEQVPGWQITSPADKYYSVHIEKLSDCGEGLFFGNKPPNNCHLVAPEDKSEDQPRRPKFSWIDADDAQSATLVIYNRLGMEVFRQEFTPTQGAEHTFTLTTDLDFVNLYTWNVYTTTSAGTIPAVEGGWTFRVKNRGTISGYKFLDYNGNGIRDEEDDPLPGWKIILQSSDQTETTLTLPDGSYSFPLSKEASFIVKEEEPITWKRTYPPDGNYMVHTDEDHSVSGLVFMNQSPQVIFLWPKDGSLFMDPKAPEFKWQNPGTGSQLKLKIVDKDNNPVHESDPGINPGTEQTFKLDSDLLWSTKYFWSIYIDNYPAGVPRSFITSPQPPVQDFPENHGPGFSTGCPLEWNESYPPTEEGEFYRSQRSVHQVDLWPSGPGPQSNIVPGGSAGFLKSYTYTIPADSSTSHTFVIPDTLEYDTEYAWIVTTYYDTVAIKSDTSWFTTEKSPVTDVVKTGIPEKYDLEQNYPNPFNPVTTIQFQIPQESNVMLKIYDILGKEVAALVNQNKPAGFYKVDWKAEKHPSGIYYYSIDAQALNSKENYRSVRKMILLK